MPSSSSSSADLTPILTKSELVEGTPVCTSTELMWRCVVKLNVNDAYLLKTIKPYYFINTGGTFAGYVFEGEEVEFDQGAMLTLRITPRQAPVTEQSIKMAWLNRMLSQIRGSLYLVRTAASTLGIEYPGELHSLGHP